MSTIILPHSDLPILLDSPGEGRSTLHQLGILRSSHRADSRATLSARLASEQSIPTTASADLTAVLTLVATAHRRLELSADLQDVTALLAYVDGAQSGLVLVTRVGLLVRSAPTLQLPDVVLEIVEDAQRAGADWSLAAWQGDDLTAALRSRSGDLQVCTDSTGRDRLQDRAVDLTGLVTQIALDTI